jgi:hypothetical protein
MPSNRFKKKLFHTLRMSKKKKKKKMIYIYIYIKKERKKSNFFILFMISFHFT